MFLELSLVTLLCRGTDGDVIRAKPISVREAFIINNG
jgi:hypothetical protein